MSEAVPPSLALERFRGYLLLPAAVVGSVWIGNRSSLNA